MGDVKGFLKIKRSKTEYRPVCERVLDYHDVVKPRSDEQSRDQASRCMDCGTPFCHWACPLANYIPEWNDLVFHQQWKKAYDLLKATNILPEVTGRVCPALCEHSCVLGINDDPVTIRENELAIIEYAFKHGLVKPELPKKRTGKKIAVVGSGPAGLSCAVHLNRQGHKVTVFERDDKVGGLMRYGIPDFKLEKKILDRRISVWKKEGLVFKTNHEIKDKKELKGFAAVCFACGSRVPRDLKVPGRDLKGIHFAMDYLVRSNKSKKAEAKGKKVVVIGGGDTGADCVGTANRQGASCVVQIEIMPQPADRRTADCPWPTFPRLLKTTSSHEEGAERHWSIITRKFVGKNGRIGQIICEKDGQPFAIEADLVILAMGFIGPEPIKGLNSKDFTCGDMRRGQSLIVWAIHEGENAAEAISNYLFLREPKR
ncbi:hypothetical protein A3F86_02060 [candidate division WOR-1 bacterium RIFCSPLOWO2_12_FULL_45_9]|uniref:Glutamate synthase n=1 Tax=candidate division WOR-1 bacterium RIFCSPLOWO2_12_FULL_45_9 TaxID=1802568 RepID=A0A1F4RPP2_UNCSA|nr:MAG: hypothetical protein A3F86_02060 [candidate division WOR-1 bacterium RIFCSPLOWO2_12_FULL_45_9]